MQGRAHSRLRHTLTFRPLKMTLVAGTDDPINFVWWVEQVNKIWFSLWWDYWDWTFSPSLSRYSTIDLDTQTLSNAQFQNQHSCVTVLHPT